MRRWRRWPSRSGCWSAHLGALSTRRRWWPTAARCAALTASELRVARRAGEGLANREIAQGLFVTVKTVEKHLAGAYRKLGCSRAELAGALGEA